MTHPTRVTFPGFVTFAPQPGKGAKNAAAWLPPKNDKGKPLQVTRNLDEKGHFKSSTVECPAGCRFEHAIREANPLFGASGRPTFVLTLVNDPPAEVLHAELEHHHEDVTREVHMGWEHDEAGKRVPTMVPVTTRQVVKVTATSTKHEGITAEGKDAAEAAANLRAAVADHVKKQTDADADAKKKADEARLAADVAEELHKSQPPPGKADDEHAKVYREG